MNFQPHTFLFAVLLGAMFFVPMACGADKEKIVTEKIAERVSAFRTKKSAECRETLLYEAEHIVDSLLLEEAKAGLSDSLSSLRPFKPLQPAPVPAIDSFPIAPLFNKPASSTRG